MQMIRRFWDVAIDLDQVQTAGLEIPTRFSDFDDYWQPFLGGQGPGPSHVMSLDEDGRQHLATALQANLPQSPDGSIQLTARAWAVKGVVADSPTG